MPQVYNRPSPDEQSAQMQALGDFIRGLVFRETANKGFFSDRTSPAMESGANLGSTIANALGLATMGIGARPQPTGFNAIRDVATRQNVSAAKNYTPGELNPGGAAALGARNALMSEYTPTVESAMRRARRPETATAKTAPQVSSQDLTQNFMANDMQNVINSYNPESPGSFGGAVRSRASQGTRQARELEATVPKPGEGDIHRQSSKIAAIQEDYRKKYGRDPSYMWIARKMNVSPQRAQEMLAESDQSRLYGSVRLDDLAKPEGNLRFRDVISAEPEQGIKPPARMQAIEGEASEAPNAAAAAKFIEGLDPQRKAILEKMMESKPVRQIAEELKAEGHDISYPTVSRRQTELLKQLKDIRENRGFLGRMPTEGEKLPPRRPGIDPLPPISGGSASPTPSSGIFTDPRQGQRFRTIQNFSTKYEGGSRPPGPVRGALEDQKPYLWESTIPGNPNPTPGSVSWVGTPTGIQRGDLTQDQHYSRLKEIISDMVRSRDTGPVPSRGTLFDLTTGKMIPPSQQAQEALRRGENQKFPISRREQQKLNDILQERP